MNGKPSKIDKSIESIKRRIVRRIIVKSIVLGIWAACMIAVMLQGEVNLPDNTLLYMTVAIIAAWAVSTIRDARRLRTEQYLKQAAIAEADERNIQTTYKATRLAAVITLCIAPVAICVLAYLGMEQAVNAIAGAIGLFAIVYLASWAYINRTC